MLILPHAYGFGVVSTIAIGNGTASRETEQFTAELIKTMPQKVSYMVVSEPSFFTFKSCFLSEKAPFSSRYATIFFATAALIPDMYAKTLIERCGIEPDELGSAEKVREKVGRVGLKNISAETGAGMPTLTDIVKELEKPGRDPRIYHFYSLSAFRFFHGKRDTPPLNVHEDRPLRFIAIGRPINVHVEHPHLYHLADLYNVQRVLYEPVAHLRDMHQTVLMHSYVNKRAEIYNVAHRSHKLHALLEVLYLHNVAAAHYRFWELVTWVASGLKAEYMHKKA